jgi:YebC/PmpR family DNA-binding regulatory protein
MAGHSKWANIKHRKGKSDAKKGKIFSRVAKEIISAVKLGGADLKNNPRLRLAIQKARASSVPNEIIERNVKKASSADQADYIEMTYEIYGYGGVGIIVEIMTDNKLRTIADVRIAINKRGGTIANPGSVTFNYDKKGIIQIPKNAAKEEELFAASINAGAEDFEQEDEMFIITTDPLNLYNVKEAIQELGFTCEEASVEQVPKVIIECSEEDQKSNLALIEWFENLDDVDSVYHNMNLKQ